jgi:two-component system chemotaxis sensor kinase CheA
MGKQLKGLTWFAGATIMGDGHVALILDVLGLGQRARLVGEHRDRAIESNSTADAAGKAGDEKQALLVFRVGVDGRMAIPLMEVNRLEEFPAERIEHSNGREVVQYRERILPLLHIERFVPGGDPNAKLPDPMPVIVHTHNGETVGLVVGKILDIVHESITTNRRRGDRCVLGSAVIQGRVTDLLDVPGLLESARVATEEGAAQAA